VRHDRVFRPAAAIALLAAFGSLVVVAPASAERASRPAATPVGPSVTVTPTTGIVDGQQVSVEFTGGDLLHAWLCTSAVVADQSSPTHDANCQGTDFLFGSPSLLTLHQTFTTTTGKIVHCSVPGDCVLLFSFAFEAPFTITPISFTTQPLAVTPANALIDGRTVDVWVTAPGGSTHQVAQCALPVGASLSASHCRSATSVAIPAAGAAHLSFTVATSLPTGGGPISCIDTPCALVDFDATGAPVASVPITMRLTPVVTLTPNTDLLDGQTAVIAGAHLLPSVAVPAGVCALRTPMGPWCIQVPQSQTRPDGTLTMDERISQALPATLGYCPHDGCYYQLFSAGGEVLPTLPYSMAEGSFGVTPSTGLADGQTVTLTGTDLLPSYSGTPWGPFGSGTWAEVECRADIGTSPTLLQAFQGCGFPGGAGVAPIIGSTLSTTVQPVASLTAVLGGVTDCRAAPGTCVLGLVRFEQDGSMSTHLVPLTFGP